MKLPNLRNYIVIKNTSELIPAMNNIFCRFIIYEQANTILLWWKNKNRWEYLKYTIEGDSVLSEDNTKGIEAYQAFYKFCGKDEIERMKGVLTPIEIWESEEQLHYYNPKFADQVLTGKFFELDVNSSFTYGVLKLNDDFKPLKDYMILLYEKKKKATSKERRQRYKNLQNFLIGYFARVKDFIALRSAIIKNSNDNIINNIAEIIKNGGNVYLSNTDSIITDFSGFYTMQDKLGDDVGKFKVEIQADKLYYKSSNVYQIGDKLVYSGMKFFARKNTNLIKGITATQDGELIKSYDISIDEEDKDLANICRIQESKIIVTVKNKLGEIIDAKIYKINLEDIDL